MQVRLARVICERYPAIEQTRFVASGTEATLGAVRCAQGPQASLTGCSAGRRQLGAWSARQ